MSLQPNQNWSDFEQLGFRSQLWLTIKRKFAKKDAGHVESIFYAAESKAADLMNPPIGLQSVSTAASASNFFRPEYPPPKLPTEEARKPNKQRGFRIIPILLRA
ncbi:hypothetical protein TWF132_009908 [Orbilia oligospora]|nr:hypothetical protein TWF751_004866 [Orbilia oligospora]KAF3242955.1 hypothetical protein TWF128_010404 [Orbilia oligospora]KAF3284017.1 hypothetical protein TWF132_009908 [Orbilia oligospora]